MDFKEMIASEIDAVFLNPDEFGETHNINGREACIVMDEHTLEKHDMADIDKKSARSDFLFYINADFFGENIPRSGKLMNYDGRNYRIDSVNSNMGLLAIKLGRPEE